MKPRPKPGERGFAMLIVFMLAAAIALMLYQQMPRVAFESQRQKEQTLIDRGQQYTRAIQLYFVAFKKYPSKIEDLEHTNNQRFLRRRYIDPMTGEDDWRLIHVNGAGQLTDSLVQKPPDSANDKSKDSQNGAAATANGAVPGAAPQSGSDAQPVNAAVLRRPSDRPLTPQAGSGASNPPSNDPDDPRNWPPVFLVPANATGATGATGAPGAPPRPGQARSPQPPGQFPGQQNPNQLPNPAVGSIPGLPPGVQVGGQQPAAPGQAAATNTPGQTSNPNPALGAINDMLTHPSQVGAGAAFNTPQPSTGGLAGVATPFDAPSIKVYNDQQQYNKWEFIFDLKQGLPGQQAPQQAQPQNANPLGTGSPVSPTTNTPGQIGPPPPVQR